MIIQFNLLPDVKIQYLKAKRQKHLVVMVSVVASAIALAVFIILLVTVFGLQKKNLSDLNTDIKASSEELQSVEDLTKILTVQNQLGVLDALHDQKPAATRLLDYLAQVTPADASISKLAADYATNTMVINGSTASLTTVNTFADTLKFTKYATSTDTSEKTAFNDVVLKSFTRDDQGATYELSFTYDPIIFNNAEQVSLKVPQITSTRSHVDKPDALFRQTEEGVAQ